MKKFFSMLALGLLFVSSASAQTAKILRHSKGQVIQYKASEISSAISEAVAGDTLYLSDGVFSGFTITKPISIIGTGQETRISGSVDISIPGNPILKSRVLDALNISGTLTLQSASSGVNVRKCQISVVSFAGNSQDVFFDRCNISNYMSLSSYVEGLTVTNSYLNKLQGASSSPDLASFVNCNIYYIETTSSSNHSSSTYFRGNLINCIVCSWYSRDSYSNYNYMTDGVYMVNCLYCTGVETFYAIKRDCYSAGSSNFSSYYMGLDTSMLTTAGYLGNDGTVVGMYGGTTPYTLTPSTPTVTSSKIAVDNEKKQLNVNITVKSNN